MKILVLNDYFSAIAGGFVVAYNLAMECRRRGHEIAFLTTVQTKAEAGLTYQDGVPVYKIHTRYPLRFRGVFAIWNPFVFREFTRIVKEVRPDVIHAHVIHFYLSHYVLKLAHDLHVPTVLTAHDTMQFCYTRLQDQCSPQGTARHKARFWECWRCQRFRYMPSRNFWLRHYLNTYAAHVISVSDALKVGLELNGIKHVQTIYNGIDPQQYRVTAEQVAAFRAKYQLDGKSVLLFAGRSNPSKGLEHLIRAMPTILAAHPAARLLMLTKRDGNTEAALKLADELGVSAALIVPGWLAGEELQSAYAVCEVCVAPSTQFEPLATVILEAMAWRKPVVGTMVGGTPEMIAHGQTGYVVPPRNSAELAAAIIALLQNQARAREFGEAGYQRIQAKFQLRQQAEQILEAYRQALEKE